MLCAHIKKRFNLNASQWIGQMARLRVSHAFRGFGELRKRKSTKCLADLLPSIYRRLFTGHAGSCETATFTFMRQRSLVFWCMQNLKKKME